MSLDTRQHQESAFCHQLRQQSNGFPTRCRWENRPKSVQNRPKSAQIAETLGTLSRDPPEQHLLM